MQSLLVLKSLKLVIWEGLIWTSLKFCCWVEEMPLHDPWYQAEHNQIVDPKQMLFSTLLKKHLFFKCLQYKSFENNNEKIRNSFSVVNTVGKGEIAHNKQFLLFPQCFSTLSENFKPFSSNLKLSSANCFRFEESKVCCSR